MKLKTCEPEIRYFVIELQKQNAKAQMRIVKLEAENMTQKNRIAALEKRAKHPEKATVSWLPPQAKHSTE